MFRSVSFEDDPRWNFHWETAQEEESQRFVTDHPVCTSESAPSVLSEVATPQYTPRNQRSNPIQSPPFVVNNNSSNDPTMSEENEGHPWQDDMAILRQALRRQEEMIQRLQQENSVLRSKLNDKESNQRKTHNEESAAQKGTPKPFVNHQDFSDHHRSTPPVGNLSRSSTPPSLLRHHSPGVTFVEEFVQVMELNAGHHTLLASIMDRYFERQCSRYNTDERFR